MVPEKLEKEETGSMYQTSRVLSSTGQGSLNQQVKHNRAKAYSSWKTRNAQIKNQGL